MAGQDGRRRRLPKWRFTTWVLVAFNALMLLWVVAGASTDATEDCATETYVDACEAGSQLGKGIGMAALIALWIFGGMFLGLVWLITARRYRSCPVCGRNVKRGLTACADCGTDFRSRTAAS